MTNDQKYVYLIKCWEPPTAYSPRSVATIANSSLGIVLCAVEIDDSAHT